MTEATWGDAAETPQIEWRISASLENVPRGDGDLAEVTSLERAVRAWAGQDPEHQRVAVLTPERAVQFDGIATEFFEGEAIRALSERLPTGAIQTSS